MSTWREAPCRCSTGQGKGGEDLGSGGEDKISRGGEGGEDKKHGKGGRGKNDMVLKGWAFTQCHEWLIWGITGAGK